MTTTADQEIADLCRRLEAAHAAKDVADVVDCSTPRTPSSTISPRGSRPAGAIVATRQRGSRHATAP
jgi:hypothetical protein